MSRVKTGSCLLAVDTMCSWAVPIDASAESVPIGNDGVVAADALRLLPCPG